MIGSLRGVLLDRSPAGEVLVEVGGVVMTPADTARMARLSPVTHP